MRVTHNTNSTTTEVTKNHVMLEVLADDDPGHEQDKQAQYNGYQHGGDYLLSISVMTKLCIVTMATMHMTVSMEVFTGYRSE